MRPVGDQIAWGITLPPPMELVAVLLAAHYLLPIALTLRPGTTIAGPAEMSRLRRWNDSSANWQMRSARFASAHRGDFA